jgi:hypothetical protein
VASGLSNVMAVAAGRAHGVALKNDGTVVAWGDNSVNQTNTGAGLKWIKSIAAGGDHTLAVVFSSLVQYQVDVSKDLLLIYNTNSLDSSNVCAYYLAHRPQVTGANVLPLGCPTTETVYPWDLTNTLLNSVSQWLEANPTKRPQYVVLFLDIPSRVNGYSTNGYANTNIFPSVSHYLHTTFASWSPFLTHINMNGTNDCRAYIDKLRFFGTNYSPGKLIISASAGGYGNTNYVVDNVRHEDYPNEFHASFVRAATNGLLNASVPAQSILYAEDLEPCINGVLGRDADNVCTNGYQGKMHLTNVVDVAGYISWGFHTTLEVWTPERVKWTGNSGWWVIETIESFNGQRSYVGIDGLFLRWFSSSAFGGTNYSSTPVGGVTHVEEPQLPGVNDSELYFGLWASRKNFAICAWNSRETPFFQAVGDPFVRR